MNPIISLLALGLLAAWSPRPCRAGDPAITVVRRIEASARSNLYPGAREPLLPSPLVKLPIGSIVPQGWLRGQLERERDGMIGRLPDLSPWLDLKESAWASSKGEGKRGWEELPYWLKGLGDLGYVLDDQPLIGQARTWIEAVLGSQREDGWFGPRALLTGLDGKPDLWPHMVMLNVLQSYHEFSHDQRVLALMTRYFAWENRLPATAFGEGYWPKLRAGDNIESVHWLYDRTGEPSLLELAAKIHAHMARWVDGVIDWHNVNIAQGFRAPAMFYPQGRVPELLAAAERNYLEVMDRYGQFPGGGFAGDENCRPGFADPRQGFETCGMVELLHSFELMTRVSGDPVWADRAEEVACNSLPAAFTPDAKALHYLTAANQVVLDAGNKAPGIQNGGTMFSYSPFEVYRCCQHNASHGWPYYAEELWLATGDGGLCASLYAACDVRAQVAHGETVTIRETTDYPFDGAVKLALDLPDPIVFPLYVRVPRWAAGARLSINGEDQRVTGEPLSYLRIERTWRDGDVVTLELPMRVEVRRWPKSHGAASVHMGALAFSLAITEEWRRRHEGVVLWPEWEVYPRSPWNYGLVLDPEDATRSFTIARASGPLASQPFTPASAPITLTASARAIPEWQLDRFALVAPLQESPVRSGEPVEQVRLIPMGAARLRISAFPVIGTDRDAHEWRAPPQPKPPRWRVSASHCFAQDTVDALADELEPVASNDASIPRFTWWDHRGTREWVQYDFDAPQRIASAGVYWFDDTGSGACRVPRSWRLLVRRGDAFEPVPDATGYGTERDRWNEARFPPIEASALRLEVELAPGFSGGILEWRVGE